MSYAIELTEEHNRALESILTPCEFKIFKYMTYKNNGFNNIDFYRSMSDICDHLRINRETIRRFYNKFRQIGLFKSKRYNYKGHSIWRIDVEVLNNFIQSALDFYNEEMAEHESRKLLCRNGLIQKHWLLTLKQLFITIRNKLFSVFTENNLENLPPHPIPSNEQPVDNMLKTKGKTLKEKHKLWHTINSFCGILRSKGNEVLKDLFIKEFDKEGFSIFELSNFLQK